ncbi:HNH endonuclease [Ochrobactrum sp. CM-21-5]|nr:HNH endonuclease signature motif containing protein [Ochrobactrum sp. CM-21-5]MBC2887310.1 HNH endonuclease [Ochrobactrum sp. CM-21-5]
MTDAIYAGDAGYFKTCTCCGETKAAQRFSKERRWGDGFCSSCKDYKASSAREWAKKNPEQVSGRYMSLSPDRRADIQRKRLEKLLTTPGAIEKTRERARDYYAKNREKVLARMSSQEGREYSRIKMQEKMRDDAFRLHSNISRAIRASIKDKYRRPWETLVGYNLNELMTHIERQFLPGMTWENHGKGKGKWHIDHIVPRSSFGYDSAEHPDFAACWALANLRPLWSDENIRKHAKRLFLI